MTDAWMNPEGGDEMPERPTVTSVDSIPVAYGRDAQTDSRRMSEVDGGDGNIMDDRDLDDVGYLSDLDATSLGQEARAGGWIPIAKPVGGEPARVNTSGTRGADDIGKV